MFIAILSEKLPPQQRDRARFLGLFLSLIIRLALLSLISWVVTLMRPIFSIACFSFSGKDLILMIGGVFLLCKATMELHERLEKKEQQHHTSGNYSSIGAIIIQMILLDTVFSIDAIITAVGMVNSIPVMMIAVVISMIIMLIYSSKLTRFVNRNQTVVVLCLSFLLMIGFSLIAEGFGMTIPKGYLYVAIGFSIVIELFNQIACRNFIRNQSNKIDIIPPAATILPLMDVRQQNDMMEKKIKNYAVNETVAFYAEEKKSILLAMATSILKKDMIPRKKISWLDCNKTAQELRDLSMKMPDNIFPVCNGELDKLIGSVCAKELIHNSIVHIASYAATNPPIIISENFNIVHVLKELMQRKNSNLVLMMNEEKKIQGLMTSIDILKAITISILSHSEKI